MNRDTDGLKPMDSPSSPKMEAPSRDLSIVIPVYNERENLMVLEEELEKHLPALNLDYEILLVDDGSLDGSPNLIRALQRVNPRLRLVRFQNNDGQTSAFAAGFQAAHGKIIVTMDADLQNDPADIPRLLEKMKNHDVVCGWRQERNDPWIRKMSSRVANTVRNRLSDEDIADIGCSLKAFRRECFESVKLFKGMHRFFPTLLKMEGFQVAQVKVRHHPRRRGHSKYNIRNRLLPSFLDLLAIRWMKKRQLKFQIMEED